MGVSCAFYCVEDDSALSFHKTIDSELYLRLNLSLLFAQLTDEEILHGRFLQDNVTSHTLNSSVVVLDKVFSKRVLS